MPQPNKIPKPFAASGDKNTIPESTETIGLASWNEGFPAITSTPFAEGGLAPKRNDFNGIFNALSAATVWQQQGGFYAYDNTTDYEVGNVVEYSGELYKCITANGPLSAVKAPTDATVWSKVMTAADAAAAYLPLSGGTLTGGLLLSGNPATIATPTTDTYFRIVSNSYDGGASLYLSGKDRPTDKGTFSLVAYDGVNRRVFGGNPNGTLTWDGYNVITSAGGTMTGSLKAKMSATRGTAPAAKVEKYFPDYIDANNTRYGLLQAQYNTDMSSEMALFAYNTTRATGNNIGRLGIGCTSSGAVYTVAPTPATTDNSTNIATTEFVNNFWNSVKNKGWAIYNWNAATVPNNTMTNLGSHTFDQTGVYVVVVCVWYATNANGQRRVVISSSPTGNNGDRFGRVSVQACGGVEDTVIQWANVLRVYSAPSTIYINTTQSSGSSLSCSSSGLKIMRVGDA